MLRTTCLVIALSLASPVCIRAADALAEDATTTVKEWKTADGTSSVKLPAAWPVTILTNKADKRLLLAVAQTPRGSFFQVEGTFIGSGSTPLSALHALAAYWRTQKTATDVRIVTTPFPHLIVTDKGDSVSWSYVYRFFRSGRSVQAGVVTVKPEALEDLLPVIRDALTSYVPPQIDRAPPPDGYVQTPKSAIEWWSDPSVKPPAVAKAQAVVAAAYAGFTKRFGALDGATMMLPRVFLHADRAACAAAVSAGADYTDTPTQFAASRPEAVIHLYPFDDRDPALRAGASVCTVATLVFCRFGSTRPTWLNAGAQTLALAEARTQKAHPAFPEAMRNYFREGTLDTLAVLDATAPGEVMEKRSFDATAMTLVLTDGPADYRAAFKRFAETLMATGDDREAMKHLLALDQAKLAADARKHFDEKTKWITPK